MVPDLVTPRLHLRPPTAYDAEAIVDLHGDGAVMRFIDDGRSVPPDVVRDRDLGWLLRNYGEGVGYWIGMERAGADAVGWFGLRPRTSSPLEVELGFRLRPQFWGRGLATEAATALVEYAFGSAGVKRVFATTMVANVGSRRVLERAGLRLRRTWTYDGPDPIPGAELGDVDYALTVDEWRRRIPLRSTS